MRGEAGRALAFASARLLAAPYVLASDGTAARAAVSLSVPARTIEKWLREKYYRPRIGPYASLALGLSGRREAAPLIRRMLHEKKQGWLRVAAARALVDLDAASVACDLVALMGADDMVVQDHVPSLFLDVARRDPPRGRECLARGLAGGDRQQRETAAWTAGVLRDPGLVDALVGVAARREEPAQLAALWALGEIGDRRAAPVIAEATANADPAVRGFALDAQRKLGAAALVRG
jgi:HEAT repeat protein